MSDTLLPDALSGMLRQPLRNALQRRPWRVLTPHLILTPRRGRMPRRNRRGLIGILLSIIVAVAIIITVFAIYNLVTGSANAAQTAVFVRQLAPQITSQYRGNYTNLNAGAAISSGFVPDNWREDSNIRSPNGAAVTIAGTATNFTITFTGGVQEQTCNAVLGALKSDRTFVNVNAGGTEMPRAAVGTASAISGACSGSGGSNFVLTFN